MPFDQSTSSEQFQQWSPAPKDYEEHMTWRMRWYLVIAITIAYILSLIGGLIGFGITKDPRYLAFIAPTALIPLVRYLVPMDKKRHELELAKISASKELIETRLQVQMLKAELDELQDGRSTSPVIKVQEQLPTK